MPNVELTDAENTIIINRRDKQRTQRILAVVSGFYAYSLVGQHSLSYADFLDYLDTLSPSEKPPNIEDSVLHNIVTRQIYLLETSSEPF